MLLYEFKDDGRVTFASGAYEDSISKNSVDAYNNVVKSGANRNCSNYSCVIEKKYGYCAGEYVIDEIYDVLKPMFSDRGDFVPHFIEIGKVYRIDSTTKIGVDSLCICISDNYRGKYGEIYIYTWVDMAEYETHDEYGNTEYHQNDVHNFVPVAKNFHEFITMKLFRNQDLI